MFFVYILASKRNGTLYVGHTDELGERILQHKQKAYAGFSSKYDCNKLVWFETHETRESAFQRERQLKKWNRAWKIRRIEADNPNWMDLYDRLTEYGVYHSDRYYDPKKL
ncbi:MAG: GIY-YIG nuclease family protein [Robiginitomaculum sp.]|nr:GIY-YIG nuclease family protein [Robiginitomaculum sp.]